MSERRAAGWYRDPTNAPVLRYWDGARWTEHTATDPDDTGLPGDTGWFSSRRNRRTAAVAVVLVGVALFLAYGPRPTLDRERAVNGISVEVSTDQHHVTRNEANCVVDEAVKRGLSLRELAHPELLDPDKAKVLRSTLRPCKIPGS